MKQADLIIKNAHILCMDKDFHMYSPGAVAVSGNTIAAVGNENEILEQYNADEVFDCGEKILLPGLINAHTHVPMTLLRGLADDLRLDVWLMGYMMPVEREFVDPAFVKLGTKIACAEMIECGVTTFADMYYFEDDVAEATVEAGLRGLLGQSVLKFPAPDASSYDVSLQIARQFIQKWKGHSLIMPAIAPHAPYTCTEEILQACAALALEFDVPLHTHVAETAHEVETLRQEQGMPVIPWFKKQNILETKAIAAHCVHIDEGEMRSMARANMGIAHNPSSNLKLASGFAPISRIIELGINVGIGTDGPASNNDLDMIEEMRLASFIAKCATGDPTALPARTTLEMATSMGARALHIDHLVGSIEAGKRADMITIDISPLHNSPKFRHDPNGVYAQIIYAAKATDIMDVMVDGKWLMKARQLLTLDKAELLQEGQQYAERIDQFLIRREQSVLSKLIAIGGAMEEESFEVQAKVRIDNPETIISALNQAKIEIIKSRHYHEFDTYFFFDDPKQGVLRYREDEFISPAGTVTNVRGRLTLIGEELEDTFEQEVVLSRSRYYAPANHSQRFYREYFKPVHEVDIQKNRRRFQIQYNEIDFYVNVDTIQKPDKGHFLEIKSRTWSRQDAEEKSALVVELIKYLGASPDEVVTEDYIEMFGN